MDDRPLLLLPSPFLGVGAYDPLVGALRRRGAEVVVADATDPVSGPALVGRWGALAADLAPRALLAHSNAGYLAPVVRASSHPLLPLVLVDAALPPTQGPARLAPAAFRDHLAGLAGPDGLLPPWTRWWPEEDLEAVVPPSLAAELDAACPRVPLSYVDSEVTAPAGWTEAATAYLAYGDTYADEVGTARAHGWRLGRLDGGHLHHLWEPDAVAAAVEALLSALRPED